MTRPGDELTCAICERASQDPVCPDCTNSHLYPDCRTLRSPDGLTVLNARSYVPDHHRLIPGATYTVEELRRDYGMPRLSKLGPEPDRLRFVVERLA